MTERIEHDGIIDSIDAQKIHVRIVSESACSGCHAKGACSAADLQDKLIDINHNGNEYKPGQRVTIYGQKTLGFKAVALAYVIPSVIVLTSLIITYYTTLNDVLSALVSIGVLVPYFVVIYMLRSQFERTFTFFIKHTSHQLL
jgi:sigma-E factor negative regulatory protein RseC